MGNRQKNANMMLRMLEKKDINFRNKEKILR